MRLQRYIKKMRYANFGIFFLVRFEKERPNQTNETQSRDYRTEAFSRQSYVVCYPLSDMGLTTNQQKYVAKFAYIKIFLYLCRQFGKTR